MRVEDAAHAREEKEGVAEPAEQRRWMNHKVLLFLGGGINPVQSWCGLISPTGKIKA